MRDVSPEWSISDHELVAPQEDEGLGSGTVGLGVSLASPPRPPIRGLFGFRGGSFDTLQFLFAFLRVERPTGGELRPVLGITERSHEALGACPAFGGLTRPCRSVERRFGVHLEALPGQVGQAGGGRLGGGGDGGIGWVCRVRPGPGVPSQPAWPLHLGGAQGSKCYASLCSGGRTTGRLTPQNHPASQCCSPETCAMKPGERSQHRAGGSVTQDDAAVLEECSPPPQTLAPTPPTSQVRVF